MLNGECELTGRMLTAKITTVGCFFLKQCVCVVGRYQMRILDVLLSLGINSSVVI